MITIWRITGFVRNLFQRIWVKRPISRKKHVTAIMELHKKYQWKIMQIRKEQGVIK